MKTDIHPQNQRYVIFHDTTSDEKFLIQSTVETDQTDKWEDGNEYPLYKVEISSASHPFYTGKETIIDSAGRVDKFKARAAKAKKTTDSSTDAQDKQSNTNEDKQEQEA
jgi:large subunit ribosomal protein L31